MTIKRIEGKVPSKLELEVVEKKTWKLHTEESTIVVEHHDCSKPLSAQRVVVEIGAYVDDGVPLSAGMSWRCRTINLSAEQMRELCETILASLPKKKVTRGS